jgi:hypothetical protein
LGQISDRRDQERKAFSRMFQPSGRSDESDKVLFLLPHSAILYR